ncbi:immunoglobulin-like domain-containing protein [Enterococcus faecium]|uniref:immunoglobulin-like domain-containing protein n=1 Tax=Enterococcus faecium TaxID=1352 RepID=UPI0033971347
MTDLYVNKQLYAKNVKSPVPVEGLKANTEYEVYVENALGRSNIIKQTTSKSYLNVQTFNLGTDTGISGTVSTDVKKFVLEVNDTKYDLTSSFESDGSFFIGIKDEIKTITDDVTVLGLDQDGVEIITRKVKMIQFSLNPYIIGEKYITGIAKGGIKNFALMRENVQLTKGGGEAIDPDSGTFKYYVKSANITTSDCKLSLRALDSLGANPNVLAELPLVVQPPKASQEIGGGPIES